MTAQAGSKTHSEAPLLHKIHHFVKRQHIWAYWSYAPQIRYHYRAERTKSLAFREWIKDEWKHRAHTAYDHYQLMALLTPPWACIHRYEGSWRDPNAPYWGGLQMDIPFQTAYNPRAYAHYGTADHWPISDQVIAAKRAYAVRGYTPWPNTAHYCGLL